MYFIILHDYSGHIVYLNSMSITTFEENGKGGSTVWINESQSYLTVTEPPARILRLLTEAAE